MNLVETLYQALFECEYVLIGAGAGLSAAAGISFADEVAFRADYPMLWEQGIHSDYQTFSYKGWLEGQRWGYLAQHIKKMLFDQPGLPMYHDLKALLEGTNYHVITSNVDRQFAKAGFPMERVFEAQGSYEGLICSAGCTDEEWDIAPYLETIRIHTDPRTLCVPQEFEPTCPHCGAPLRMAFRDTKWHKESEARYRAFLQASEGYSIAIIEFGVGFNSAGVIRVPFERMTGERPEARFFRITVDYADSEIEIAYPEIPKPIADKSLSINRNAADVIGELLTMKKMRNSL